jgi:membrane protease YdiL (CAAX protease family)
MWGLWASIVINTLLYGALHAFAHRKEVMASVLFGPVLCFLTIQFQALWPAIALHLFVAAFYEGKQLNYHFKSLKQSV